MSLDVSLSSGQTSAALQEEGRDGLEDDLMDFFDGELDVTGAGAFLDGSGWDISFTLEGEDPQGQLQRLIAFLRGWGVPRDTHLSIQDSAADEDAETQSVDVFPTPERAPTREEFLAAPLALLWHPGVQPAWVGEAYRRDKELRVTILTGLSQSIDIGGDLGGAGGWRELLTPGFPADMAASLVAALKNRFADREGEWQQELAELFPE